MAIYKGTELLANVSGNQHTATYDSLPVGTIVASAINTDSKNFLVCDGRYLDPDDYPELFSAISYTFGQDDNNNFKIPNLSDGRIPVSISSTDIDFTQGTSAGEKTHTLTISEMPSHNHPFIRSGRVVYWDSGLTPTGQNYGSSNTNYQVTWDTGTQNRGGGEAHNNLQPYLATGSFLIKCSNDSITLLDEYDVKDIVKLVLDNVDLSGSEGSGGHIISDESQDYTQRSRLKFIGAEIKDTENATEVITPSYDLSEKVVEEKPNVVADRVPLATIMPYGGPINTITEGYLPCLGQEVSRALYHNLFDIIGTTYGSGDGLTTFNLPNYGGRLPVGLDENDDTFNELGKTLGEKKHILLTSELPSHTHGSKTLTGGAHFHYQGIGATSGIMSSSGTEFSSSSGSPYTSGGANLNINATHEHESVGENKAHNNIQPSIVANYIIKVRELAVLTASLVDSLAGNEIDKAPSVHAVNEAINNFSPSGGSGSHTILDSQGTELPQESKLKFDGVEVTDDNTNGTTVVTTPSIEVLDSDNLGTIPVVQGDEFPIGAIIPFGGQQDKIESGYLPCLGQEVSRTKYKSLFDIIGTIWGGGDGSTTFNLPNLQNNTLVGLNENDDTFNELGKVLGEKTHKLTVSELASHTHKTGISKSRFGGLNAGTDTCIVLLDVAQGSESNTTGSDTPHNNIQPSAVVNFIIKYKKKIATNAQAVNSLEGNEEDMVPTVYAVNEALANTGNSSVLIKRWEGV